MKKLLNVLYVTTPETYLSLDGRNIIINKDNEVLGRFPLHNFEGIVAFGYAGASPALMHACAEQGIPLNFMKPSGKFLARVTGETKGNVALRKTQYRYSDSEERSLAIAKNIIAAKMYNSRWVIERATRDHGIRLDVEKLKNASGGIKLQMNALAECKDLDQLRGVEGNASRLYFSVFDMLILNQKDDFYFTLRTKHPPLDNLNAVMSFMYVVCGYEIASALETVGLDPYVGFLHQDRPGRISLGLDLLEELRSVLIDRFVLSMVNKQELNTKDFTQKENGAVSLNDNGKRTVFTSWQNRKKEEIEHPFIKEKIQWGLVPYVQANLLARYLRGDLDEYPPFFWK